MDTRELIQSIIASEEDAGDKFLESMEERISDALEVRKVELASGMMDEEAEQMNEWRYREVEQQQRRIARGMSPEESERRMKEVRDREDAARIKKRAAAKAAKAAKKTNEDVEQIDEVSGSMLKNRYISAARKDRSAAMDRQSLRSREKDNYDDNPDPDDDKDSERIAKREKGIRLANAKTNKSGTSREFNHYSPVTAKVKAPYDPRAQVKPRIKEEVEQVDEALESEFKDLGKRRNDTGRELEDADYQKHTYKVPKGLKPKFDTPVSRYKMLRKKTNEDVEQVDEAKYKGLSRDTLAKYNVAAARRIRSSTSLARGFDDEAATQRRRGNKEDADANQSLSSEFQRAAKNRIRGIERATERLAREEVEQIDEINLSAADLNALRLMKDVDRQGTTAALRMYHKAGGNINKLAMKHRQLVTDYLSKAGGLGNVSRGVMASALRTKKEQDTEE